jgi:geranylgeranyl pyrophosphate synthase
MRDDLLNAEDGSQQTGKPVDADAALGKLTLLSLLGAQECRRLISVLTADALGYLAAIPGSAFLAWLAEWLLRRTN